MFRNKLKEIIRAKDGEHEGNDKKKIENLVFFIIILIITTVIINIILNGKSKSSTKEDNNSGKKLAIVENTSLTNDENVSFSSNSLEEKLKGILEKIQGVGEVNVFINYSESSEIIAMYNENSKTSTTEETDTSGGTRKIEQVDCQKDIVYQEENGEKTPITQKILEPKIEGAIITAKGAKDINVKSNIIQAVEAVTGLATHKIQVFEMN